ncbi:ASST-domain-containing protein [Neohortaea acidophila]|uniref:ASST-domain-containing protein n=1 Tax=Neohortaea acidophila TaxID=245834 RepID=A0A6A6PZ18_9PEZI|nr:ASST-domain-containing protein [Neohortaea acidophila]KAF2485016.1 ASST-domain-containing protein [Neohortaea acidophila]
MRLLLAFAGCALAARLAHTPKANSSAATIPSHAYVQVETDPKGAIWPWRVFKSSPYTPPNMTITVNQGELADGFIFMTPANINLSAPAAEMDGGFIMTSDNEAVFALNTSGITDFRVQHYKGQPYLTYWSGYNTEGANVGHGYGQVNFVDSSYSNFSVNPDLGLNKLVTTPVANWSIDIHEHLVTPWNTLLVSAYNNTPWDLSPYGGPVDGWIADSLAVELDIETWEVLFKWVASEHVPLSESQLHINASAGIGTIASPWDWFHINAGEMVGSDYLINSRHCWSTYYVSGTNGSVQWRIQGVTGGDFGPLPADSTFSWQHYARAHNVTPTGMDLSVFDNHNTIAVNGTPSNGLVFHLELPPSTSYTPQLLRKIETPSEPIYADSQGDYIVELSNGNQLLGYGQIAITREYGPATDGSDLRWQAQFGGLNTVQSYRAFKHVWHATPAAWDPSLVVESGYAYVSWNGATEVEAWNVYVANSTSANGTLVGQAAKEGFETVFEVPAGAATLQVAAVQKGDEVRRSNTVHIGSVW